MTAAEAQVVIRAIQAFVGGKARFSIQIFFEGMTILLTAITAITALLLAANSILLFLMLTAGLIQVDGKPQVAYVSHGILDSRVSAVVLNDEVLERLKLTGSVGLEVHRTT